MGTKEIAVEILKNTASMMSETVTQKAASSLSTVSKSSEPIKLPLLTDDENVLKYVKELQLEGNDNAMEFLANTFKDKGIDLDSFITMKNQSKNITDSANEMI